MRLKVKFCFWIFCSKQQKNSRVNMNICVIKNINAPRLLLNPLDGFSLFTFKKHETTHYYRRKDLLYFGIFNITRKRMPVYVKSVINVVYK